MCYFISIAVPSSFRANLSAWKQRGYLLNSYLNPCLSASLPKDFATFTLTNGMCSCDLCKTSKKNDLVSLRGDVLDILRPIVADTKRIFVYVHFYSGDVSSEVLAIQEQLKVTLNSLLLKRDYISEDAVVEVTQA